MVAFAVAILWPAGSWQWWQGWMLIGTWVAFLVAATVFLSRHDPALLAERLKASPVQEGQATWDKLLMLLVFVTGVALFIVPGFDVVRYGWSEPLPVWLEILAIGAHLPAFVFLVWIMSANTYLSRVVKTDDERGQQVITTGPYALVRHPMYSAAIVLVLAMPTALGSRYGLIPAAIFVCLMIVRTQLEDRFLQARLPGYREYTEQTRYRLIPGIW